MSNKLVKDISVAEIKKIIEEYPQDKRFALAILQDIQRHFNYIPQEAFPEVGEHLGATYADLYAMATFYRALSINPKGQHILKVCDGTACHIKGGTQLQHDITDYLGIEPGQTTEDGMFTLETISCPGCCAMAPVLIIDENYYPKVDAVKLKMLIDEVKGGAENDR